MFAKAIPPGWAEGETAEFTATGILVMRYGLLHARTEEGAYVVLPEGVKLTNPPRTFARLDAGTLCGYVTAGIQ